MNKEDLTVVVVSYYRGERLNKCLNTIGSDFNIIVWDNDTRGHELDKVKKAESHNPHAHFTYSKGNVGLVKAWNQGIVQSNTDWVILTCDDMLFDSDWFEVFTDILKEKPHLEQVHLNSFNCIALHKKTIVRMGWWDEHYRYYPSMEDDDWYLRTVEVLGYSPYGGYADHIPFPKDYTSIVDPYINARKTLFHKADNFTYYCNSEHSKHKVIGLTTITGGEDDAGSRNTAEGSIDKGNNINGVQYHQTKWQLVDPRVLSLASDKVLLGKDGRCWKRLQHDLDFYPDIRRQYAKKYFNIDL